MTVLITGGAGYIGSHIVRAFRLAGLDCIVVDDFVGRFLFRSIISHMAKVVACANSCQLETLQASHSRREEIET